MSKEAERLEVVRGSGNVFRDFGDADADVLQTKSLLGAEIIGILDDEGLSTRRAQALTGVDHSDFVRIRNAKLTRFTIDRLMTILNLLGRDVDVRIRVQLHQQTSEPAVHP